MDIDFYEDSIDNDAVLKFVNFDFKHDIRNEQKTLFVLFVNQESFAFEDEEAIVQALIKQTRAIFAGKIEYKDAHALYFYNHSAKGMENVVKELLSAKYKYNTYFSKDKHFDLYYKDLFPSDVNLQKIDNRHLVQKHEAFLQEPVSIVHILYFSTPKQRENFTNTLEESFQIEELFNAEEQGEYSYGLYLCEEATLSVEHLNKTAEYFIPKIKSFYGVYAGWDLKEV